MVLILILLTTNDTSGNLFKSSPDLVLNGCRRICGDSPTQFFYFLRDLCFPYQVPNSSDVCHTRGAVSLWFISRLDFLDQSVSTLHHENSCFSWCQAMQSFDSRPGSFILHISSASYAEKIWCINSESHSFVVGFDNSVFPMKSQPPNKGGRLMPTLPRDLVISLNSHASSITNPPYDPFF